MAFQVQIVQQHYLAFQVQIVQEDYLAFQVHIVQQVSSATLLEKFWRILLYVTDDAIAKLQVKKSLAKQREMFENQSGSSDTFSNSEAVAELLVSLAVVAGQELFFTKRTDYCIISSKVYSKMYFQTAFYVE